MKVTGVPEFHEVAWRACDKRAQYPESSQWETETGSAWLRLMFFSTLYQFGLKSGIGVDSLSEFFTLVRMDIHIGVSAHS